MVVTENGGKTDWRVGWRGGGKGGKGRECRREEGSGGKRRRGIEGNERMKGVTADGRKDGGDDNGEEMSEERSERQNKGFGRRKRKKKKGMRMGVVGGRFCIGWIFSMLEAASVQPSTSTWPPIEAPRHSEND